MKIRSVGKIRNPSAAVQIKISKKGGVSLSENPSIKKMLDEGRKDLPEMTRLSKKYFNREWKKPFTVIVDNEKDAIMLGKAIVWYHATEPKIRKVTVPVRHKEGLVWMEGTAWEVSSDGYQAW